MGLAELSILNSLTTEIMLTLLDQVIMQSVGSSVTHPRELSYFSAYQSNYEVREADSGKDLSVNLSYREAEINSFTSPGLRINQPPTEFI